MATDPHKYTQNYPTERKDYPSSKGSEQQEYMPSDAGGHSKNIQPVEGGEDIIDEALENRTTSEQGSNEARGSRKRTGRSPRSTKKAA